MLHLVGILFPRINDDARSKSHQTLSYIFIEPFWHSKAQWIASFYRTQWFNAASAPDDNLFRCNPRLQNIIYINRLISVLRSFSTCLYIWRYLQPYI